MGKIIFIGGITTPQSEEYMKKELGTIPYLSSDPLQKDIIRGLRDRFHNDLKIYNVMFFPNTKKPFRSKKSVEVTELGEINNVPFLCYRIVQHFSKMWNIYQYLKPEIMDVDKIIAYSAYYPFLMALSRLKSINSRLEISLVVPDLPLYIGLDNNNTLYNRLSRLFRTSMFSHYSKCVDKYILLTKYMNSVVNKSNKPFMVMEGIAPKEYERVDGTIIRRIVYSGTLQLKYGLPVLLEAIALVKDPDISFEFYGSGEGKYNIEEASMKDPRIKYKGVLQRKELHAIQQRSLALINPRQNNDEFTRYSFPSKILEYMLSGRPVIAYCLDGMPEEYRGYILEPNDNSAESLAFLIEKTIHMNETQLKEIGEKARQFVSEKKDYINQTSRIIDFLNSSMGDS